MTEKRWYHAAAALGGHVVVTGGYGVEPDFATLASAEAYDENADEWTPVAAMAGPRARHGAATLGNVLYVFGGCADYGCARVLSSVEAFYPGAPAWVELAASALPSPRNWFGTAVINSAIVVVGGCTNFACRDQENHGALVFKQTGTPHPYSGAWSPAASLPSNAGACFGPAAAAVGETLYTFNCASEAYKCVGKGCFTNSTV